MKTITILAVVQTGILLFLLGKIVLFEEETTVAGNAGQNTLVSDPFDDPPPDRNATAIHYVDYDQLRQIIREELRAQLDGRSGSDKKMDAVIASDSTDTAENQYQRELVAQQLLYHTSVGSISNVDMQKLQGEIAKLDAASQKEMLGKLTRALNSGELDGRL